jgi:hypothetical protein
MMSRRSTSTSPTCPPKHFHLGYLKWTLPLEDHITEKKVDLDEEKSK